MYQYEKPEQEADFDLSGEQSNLYTQPRVLEAYWSDGEGNRITARQPNTQPSVYLRTQNITLGSTVQIQISDWDDALDPDDGFGTFDVVVGPNGIIEQRVPRNFVLSSRHEDVNELYFQLSFERNGAYWESAYYPESTNEYLKTSVIDLLPQFMREINMPRGALYMQTWMDRPANNNAKNVDPVMGMATMDYILSFERGRAVYDGIFAKELWSTKNAQFLFRRRIAQMIFDKVISIPDEVGQEAAFGVTDDSPIHYEDKRIPTFHKYQIQRKGFEQDEWNDPLDDFYAGAGNFTFYVIPFGTVKKSSNDNWKFVVDEVGVYTGDLFDFNGSQTLGYWSEANRDATKNLWGGNLYPSYQLLNNGDFREWRDNHNMGGDYYMYSDIIRTPLNDPMTFELTSEEYERYNDMMKLNGKKLQEIGKPNQKPAFGE
ncbi:MAG: hypothetical protein GQ574_02660 [Crocinitomix sp.]|nr:hypothetical protein [Crocinitomix sp.]